MPAKEDRGRVKLTLQRSREVGNRGRPQDRRPGSREIFFGEAPPPTEALARGASPAQKWQPLALDYFRSGAIGCTLGCAYVSNAGRVPDGQDTEGIDQAF